MRDDPPEHNLAGHGLSSVEASVQLGIHPRFVKQIILYELRHTARIVNIELKIL